MSSQDEREREGKGKGRVRRMEENKTQS